MQKGNITMRGSWLLQGFLLILVLGSVSGQGAANPISYAMAENNPAGYIIGNVATAARLNQQYDNNVMQTLRFAFLEQSAKYSDMFKIGEQTAVLTAVKSIDRDSLPECTGRLLCVVPLDISVQPGQYFTIIKVNIEIQDLNDNIPNFPSPQANISISEAADIGTKLIPVPKAKDPDSPPNSIRTYDLRGDTENFELQVISTGGVLTPEVILRKKVDREEKENYQVTLEASDGGTPPQTGSVIINIQIRDVNDNIPVFDNQTYETSVMENVPKFTTVMTVHAEDADAGLYGEVVYSFTQATKDLYGSLFEIDAKTGDIYVTGIIDYEEAEAPDKRYTLDVTAQDKGDEPSPVLAKVIIYVKDVNDHAPRIRVNSQTDEGVVSVAENSIIGEFVAHITVRDPDGGDNGRFNCSLDNSQNNFILQKLYSTEFKVITQAMFDRELVPSYSLALICQDFGTPPQASTQMITVKIKDVNDHSPVFSRALYEAAIDENRPVGSWALQVTATDEDEGNNSSLKFSVAPEVANLFAIDDAGNITAKVKLDHETKRLHSFIVIATDMGTPPLSATALVRITVNDLDDNAPRFSEFTYVLNVTENQATPNVFVGQINATDPDDPPYNKFEFSLDSRYNTDDAFRIDSQTGKIYSQRALDRELRSVYHIVVMATSLGAEGLVNRTNVFISVLDLNDNSPVIEFPNFVNNTLYMHADGEGHVVTRIVAKDNDTSANSRLTYNITSGNKEGYFNVDQTTGALLLSKRISLSEDRLFSLTIRVSDQGTPPRWEEATLNIIVNKSAIVDESALMSKNNLTIVIVIAAISGVVMVVLLIAIVYIIRKQRREKLRKYNYMPRIVDQKMGQEVPVARPEVLTHPGGKVSRQPSNNSSIFKDIGALNNSYNSDKIDYPSLQRSDGSNSVFSPSDAGDGRHGARRTNSQASSVASSAPSWNMQRLGMPLETIPQNEVWVQGQNNNRPASDGDKDSESQCSADVSNADSGRGSNDDGSEQPFRASSPAVDSSSAQNSPAKASTSQPPLPTKTLPPGAHAPPYPPKRPLVHNDGNHNFHRGQHDPSRSTPDRMYQGHHQLPPRPPKGENMKIRQGNGGLYYASHV